jgi:hypothetical protein
LLRSIASERPPTTPAMRAITNRVGHRGVPQSGRITRAQVRVRHKLIVAGSAGRASLKKYRRRPAPDSERMVTGNSFYLRRVDVLAIDP